MMTSGTAGVERRRMSSIHWAGAGTVALVLTLSLLSSGCRPAAPVAVNRQLTPEQADFNHADTGFVLNGRHAQLGCEACHGDMDRTLEARCDFCHRAPHDAGLRKACTDCHDPQRGWPGVSFRHPRRDLWTFHDRNACRTCHSQLRFTGLNRNCVSCHTDFHQGALGSDCFRCHNQPAWRVNRFRHEESGFPLMGAHLGLECGDCHRDLRSMRIIPRPDGCVSCHDGQYRSASFPHAAYGAGRDCQECHLQDSWSYAHSPYWFNIQSGPHHGVECASCHKVGRDFRRYSCHDCHRGHTGDHDGRCLDCHAGGFPTGGEEN